MCWVVPCIRSIAKEIQEFMGNDGVPQLKYNDIDIYHGSFGNGDLNRVSCQ